MQSNCVTVTCVQYSNKDENHEFVLNNLHLLQNPCLALSFNEAKKKTQTKQKHLYRKY